MLTAVHFWRSCLTHSLGAVGYFLALLRSFAENQPEGEILTTGSRDDGGHGLTRPTNFWVIRQSVGHRAKGAEIWGEGQKIVHEKMGFVRCRFLHPASAEGVRHPKTVPRCFQWN
jgi:hypothetical protein